MRILVPRRSLLFLLSARVRYSKTSTGSARALSLDSSKYLNGNHPRLRPRRHPHPPLLPRPQRSWRRDPGTLLRGRVAACFRHSDRNDLPFDKESDCLGTQGFDAVADVSNCERLLQAAYWSTARVYVWGRGAKGTDGEASGGGDESAAALCCLGGVLFVFEVR